MDSEDALFLEIPSLNETPDMPPYRDFFPESWPGGRTNNLEYLDGRFYLVLFDNTLISFEMESGDTPTDLRVTPMSGIDHSNLGTYRGNLIGTAGKYLIYINAQDSTLTPLHNPTFYFLYSARQKLHSTEDSSVSTVE